MTYPLVVDLAADGIPVEQSCQVLGFSRQAFYAWRAQPVSQREWDDAHLVDAIIDIHADDPEFGYRFIRPRPARAVRAPGSSPDRRSTTTTSSATSPRSAPISCG